MNYAAILIAVGSLLASPARSALGASGLALGARVEIECLAALR